MKKDYPSGTDVVYTYDQGVSSDNPKGRLATVTDASGTVQYYYDERGRTKKTIKTVDSTPYTTETTYDSLDRVTSVKYPGDGEIVSYTYDTAGNLSTVTGATSYATYTNYTALGQARNVSHANSAATVYGYDPLNNRLTSIITTRSGG